MSVSDTINCIIKSYREQAWLNSTVKGSAPRPLTKQLYSPVHSTCVQTAAPDTAPLDSFS